MIKMTALASADLECAVVVVADPRMRCETVLVDNIEVAVAQTYVETWGAKNYLLVMHLIPTPEQRVERGLPSRAAETHGKLSPSSADVWLNCPHAAFMMSQAHPPSQDQAVAALIGTAKHLILKTLIDSEATGCKEDETIDQILKFVTQKRRQAKRNRTYLNVATEVRMEMPAGTGVKGTADVVIRTSRKCWVIDYKSGHAQVRPECSQLAIYGAMARLTYHLKQVWTVVAQNGELRSCPAPTVQEMCNLIDNAKRKAEWGCERVGPWCTYCKVPCYAASVQMQDALAGGEWLTAEKTAKVAEKKAHTMAAAAGQYATVVEDGWELIDEDARMKLLNALGEGIYEYVNYGMEGLTRVGKEAARAYLSHVSFRNLDKLPEYLRSQCCRPVQKRKDVAIPTEVEEVAQND